MKTVEITDPYPQRRHKAQVIKLLVTYVDENDTDWGEFELFRGTSWENVVCTVSGSSYSHALHGMVDPLLRELGREPSASLRKIIPEEGECGLKNGCALWDRNYCRPGGKKGSGRSLVWGPPNCYDVPINGDLKVKEIFYTVLQSLKSGHYVVVVKGGGFNYQ